MLRYRIEIEKGILKHHCCKVNEIGRSVVMVQYIVNIDISVRCRLYRIESYRQLRYRFFYIFFFQFWSLGSILHFQTVISATKKWVKIKIKSIYRLNFRYWGSLPYTDQSSTSKSKFDIGESINQLVHLPVNTV